MTRPLALAALVVLAATPARADDLPTALRAHARPILDTLRGRGCGAVGVLKFRVRHGDGPAADRAVPLNLGLAHRLEIALVLAADSIAPPRVVRDASAVAARTPGADHRTPAGRAALFDAAFEPWWGGGAAPKPDLLLTGTAEPSADLTRLAVRVECVDAAGKTDAVAAFTADLTPDLLAELGESYRARGVFDGGRPEFVPAVAVATQGAQRPHPLVDPDAPVGLEVRYDAAPVRVEVRGGKAVLPEPHAGQSVSFRLVVARAVRGRVGVVLKVNGENTLFRERAADAQCSKWVLAATDPPLDVRGYQTSDRRRADFAVLSAAESRARAAGYGPDAGAVQLTVFAEADQPAPPVPKDVAAVRGGVLPAAAAKNLSALRQQLWQAAGGGRRGLIGDGPEAEHGVRAVPFTPDPTPLLTATATYATP